MGMTWDICVKNKNYDYKKHENDPCIDDVVEANQSLTGDMVFDRECLGFWMGLSKDEYDELYDKGYIPVTKDHIEKALKVLTDMVETVKKMPFEADGFANVIHSYDKENDKWIVNFDGTPNNIEIMKVVEKVLNKEYHFNFPWNDYVKEGNGEVGVPYMIEALKEVLKYMNDNPDDTIIAFYY